MFFIVSKILSFLLSPLTWIVVSLVFAVFAKNVMKRRRAVVLALGMTLLFSNAFLFDEAMRMWEVPAISNFEVRQEHYDAAIVLSGMLVFDAKKGRVQFNRRNDRLMQALQLYRNGVVDKIILSGGSGSLICRESMEGAMIKKFLIELGFPDSVFLVEPNSDNTLENALYTSELLKKNFSNGKFLLVTSAFHMRRAMGCFRKQGMNVVPYSTDRYSGPRKFTFDHCIIPNSETLMTWDALLHEWVGCIVYKIKGAI